MTIFEATILGLVQGLTEFLPVSSSAHLIIVPKLLNFAESPLVFDTSLHIGTLLAVLIYFYKDLLTLKVREYLYIGLATLPVLVVGFLFDDYIENVFRDVSFVILFLLLGSLIMAGAEAFLSRSKSFSEELSLKRVLVVGASQILALLPGISRSGVSISTAIFSGFTREKAARVSFLLSIPATGAAAVYKLITTYTLVESIGYAPFFVGIFVSFISGMFAISFLLKLLKSKSMSVFIIYRLVLVVILALMYFRN